MIDIFCTKDSLEFIFDEYCRLRSSEKIFEYESDYLIVSGFIEIIFSRANLVTNFSFTDLENLSLSSPFFKHLIKRSLTGGSKICDQGFNETVLNNQFNDYPRAIFILDKSYQECKELEQEFGLLFLCKNNLLTHSRFLFASEVIPIGDKSKKEVTLNSWNDLQRFKHPFNAMVIIDNYLLKDEKDLITIVSLLKPLVPDQLSKQDTDFHLTLISYEVQIRTDNFNDLRCKSIEKKINSLLILPYKIKVSIINHNVMDKNHDRNILTNYVWLHSGHSFDYFKESDVHKIPIIETKKTTTLFVNGIAHSSQSFKSSRSWVDDGYDQVLTRAKVWYNEKFKRTNSNRLLE